MSTPHRADTRRAHLERLLRERRATGPAPGTRRATADHPFSRHVNPDLASMLHGAGIDVEYTRGRGCLLWDAEGNEYLDFTAGYGSLPFGHSPPAIWQAVAETHRREEPGFVQPSLLGAAGELAGRLAGIAPQGLDRVVFANSGAESVEVAIKLARSATGRLGILSTDSGFHGKTLAALSATGRSEYQAEFGAPLTGFSRVPYGDTTALAAALAQHGATTAAFVVEAIQGEGGVNVAPAGYLAEAGRLCAEHGVLLVLDEVQTGLGRTGTLFAAEQHDVVPDILTLAKALGGGVVPTAAVLTRADLLTEGFAFRHTSTFAGSALAARVGLRTLDLLTADGGALLRQVRENGERLRAGLEDIRDAYPGAITAVRGSGLLLGVELSDAIDGFGGQGLIGAMAHDENLGMLLCGNLLRREGIRVAPTLFGNRVVRVEPPLVVTGEQCDRFLEGFERAVDHVWRNDAVGLVGHLAGHRPGSGVRRPEFRHHSSYEPPAPGDSRFAFVVHPLDTDSFRDLDPSTGELDSQQVEELISRFDAASCVLNPASFVVGGFRTVSRTGAAAHCELIGLPYTAERLLDLPPDRATRVVTEAVALAAERGAELVGLGAYTSVVTANATALTGLPVPVTTGNSFTAAAGAHGVLRAAELRGRDIAATTVAVVGAAGAIGSMVARLLAPAVGGLVLLGNPAAPERSMVRLRAELALLAASVRGAGGSGPLARAVAGTDDDEAAAAELLSRGLVALGTDAAALLPDAGVVVTATSSPTSVLRAEDLAPDAVVCDLAEPSNVPPLHESRPDVFVFDGGIIALPDGQRPSVRFGLEPGQSYACLVEATLVALERDPSLASVGPKLEEKRTARLRDLAELHGFAVADLQLWREVRGREASGVRTLSGTGTGTVADGAEGAAG